MDRLISIHQQVVDRFSDSPTKGYFFLSVVLIVALACAWYIWSAFSMIYRVIKTRRAMALHRSVVAIAAERLRQKPWLCPMQNLAQVTLEENAALERVEIEAHKCRAAKKCQKYLYRNQAAVEAKKEKRVIPIRSAR